MRLKFIFVEINLRVNAGICSVLIRPHACRILNDDFQWITPNNIYYELIGTDNKRHFIFDSIWDQKYKEINSDQILELQSQSNAYIKNAYYQFKEQNNAQKTTIDD